MLGGLGGAVFECGVFQILDQILEIENSIGSFFSFLEDY
jgi:hypothetical protein